jgi:hypothetical protein
MNNVLNLVFHCVSDEMMCFNGETQFSLDPFTKENRVSSVSRTTGDGLDGRGFWIQFPAAQGIFRFSTTSRPALRFSHFPKNVHRDISPQIKTAGS